MNTSELKKITPNKRLLTKKDFLRLAKNMYPMLKSKGHYITDKHVKQSMEDFKKMKVSELREIFQKNGGNLGTQGSASHNFKHLGIIRVDAEQIEPDNILEIAINSGADECFSNKIYHEIHINKENNYGVKKNMEKKIKNFLSTNIEWYPLNRISLKKEQFLEAKKFLNSLDKTPNKLLKILFINQNFLILILLIIYERVLASKSKQ